MLLSVDGGGARGIIPVMSLIDLEHSIKQHLLDHPGLLPDETAIRTADDFDINLADYIDCMTGVSGGTWTALYLASRGGQGASRGVLEQSPIVEKYGLIPAGGAQGLRILYREYATVLYPFASQDPAAGTNFDLTNPKAPGVAAPIFTLEEIETTLRAFLGNTTLADLDSSVLLPAVDLISGYTIFSSRMPSEILPSPLLRRLSVQTVLERLLEKEEDSPHFSDSMKARTITLLTSVPLLGLYPQCILPSKCHKLVATP